ncbi:sigma-54 interaction domain-containing protein [Sporosalibacterium faouarense]|uniref:sigma-54 interaction domain-containing protein n=1 Tax=Sporosalibacterium faouarense TaxID=516123 RepID=UPI00192C0958|nr:sigma 54-interacting transcriptional regulator [Sporosalibacterium faouarense]
MKDIFLKENIIEILDYINEGIQIIDNRGRIIYYNKFAQRLDEIDREKAIGRHILEIYPSLSYDTSTLLNVIRTGEPILNIEQTFITYKGNKITTVNSSIPIKSKGKVLGALEISKDITDVKELSERIIDLQKELYQDDSNNSRKNKDKSNSNYTFVDIIGQHENILQIKSLAVKAAQTTSPILVYGETGTGKELLVQSIHSASPRKNKPFISQNCAALPSNLLEGILFGTVKGGFTGAENRPGLFELANGGTLFLDEINSMPMELQAKLLRVLQDGIIRRVGATSTISVDVRIIAATNVEPRKLVEEKRLRKDLYYRINVIALGLPKLKERRSDIPILLDHFIEKYNKKFNKTVRDVSSNVMDTFINYSWPGNIRELQHVVEGIMTIYDIEVIDIQHLPQQFNDIIYGLDNRDKVKPLNETIKEMERKIIKDALEKTNWNITHASEFLEVPRQTLQYKIKKYSLNKI